MEAIFRLAVFNSRTMVIKIKMKIHFCIQYEKPMSCNICSKRTSKQTCLQCNEGACEWHFLSCKDCNKCYCKYCTSTNGGNINDYGWYCNSCYFKNIDKYFTEETLKHSAIVRATQKLYEENQELKKENQELLLRPDGPFALLAAKRFYDQQK